MGGPCNKGGFDDLDNFCQYSRYYVASDLPNGGYTMDDWTFEKVEETEPDHQYHSLFSSNNDLEEALIGRIELKRKSYEYARNNMVRDRVPQANYLYSCSEFRKFSSAFKAFLNELGPNLGGQDLYQFLVDNAAEPDLIDGFGRVYVHRADNRDFFDWDIVANGMLMPVGRFR